MAETQQEKKIEDENITPPPAEEEQTPQDAGQTPSDAPEKDKDACRDSADCADGKKKEKEKDGKKHQLQKQVDELNAALEQEKSRYVRMMAEYENFRKRSQKERESVYADAYAEALGEIMPMVDNLERALQCDDGEQLKKGLQMVMSQFSDTLQKLGIEAYGAAGDTFDPNIHHAIMHEQDESQPENTVVEVFQRGYRRGERVIRCAMVKVVN